jgi:hypothetical protein
MAAECSELKKSCEETLQQNSELSKALLEAQEAQESAAADLREKSEALEVQGPWRCGKERGVLLCLFGFQAPRKIVCLPVDPFLSPSLCSRIRRGQPRNLHA